MVVPEEIKELYQLIDQKSFNQRHIRIDEVHQYIRAMTNLYGAFSSNLPFEVYNQQNDKKMSFQEYTDIIFRLEIRQQYFYVYHGHIISEYYELPEMEEELEQMLRERKGKPFYIPEKNELLKYVDNLYEFETPEFLSLKNFIHTKLKLEGNKGENLMDDIRYSCSMGESIKNIMEEVNRQEVVFEGMDQVNECLQLVTELSNNSRLWVNGGHTPREMFEKYDKPNLRPLPKEPFAMNPQQARSDKIGRNEPCPCGSGKKYKKCCGG
jgi:preprotein translocase subunit SecA